MKLTIAQFITEHKRLTAEEVRLDNLLPATAAEIKKAEGDSDLENEGMIRILTVLRTKYDLIPLKQRQLKDQLQLLRSEAGPAIRAMENQIQDAAREIRTADKKRLREDLAPTIHASHHGSFFASAVDELARLGNAEQLARSLEGAIDSARDKMSSGKVVAACEILQNALDLGLKKSRS